MLTEFLYPKFLNVSHSIINQSGISKEYPATRFFNNKKDFELPLNSKIVVIRENVGYKCSWAMVKFIDKNYERQNFYNQIFYVLQSSLKIENKKEIFKPICDVINNPNPKEPTIDPNLKQIFVPYVDKHNGFFSVRIQTDYQKVLDSILLDNLLEDVFYEGVAVLLSSKGFASSQQRIEELKNKFNTFAFINYDLDLTVNRPCEPLTFTVSIPLNFINTLPAENINETFQTPSKKILLNNKTIVNTFNNLANIFASRAGDILQVTYPNKFIEGFILDYEIASFKQFVLAFRDLTDLANFPVSSVDSINYEIGLDDEFNLVSLAAIKNGKKEIFNRAIFSQFKLNGEFNSKRIFNYLFNLTSMQVDASSDEINVFLNKYVDFPKPKIVETGLTVNNKEIPPEIAKEYRSGYSQASEQCITLRDVTDTFADAKVLFTDTIYNIFVTEQKQAEQTSTATRISKEIDTLEKQAREVGQASVSLNEENFSILTTISDEISNSANQVKLNVNTLLYIAERINFTDLLFKSIFCLLKGANPNDQEVIRIISELSPDIINYFNYLISIKDLKGTAFVNALASGVPLDRRLFCSKNSNISYYLKALAGLSRVVNTVGTTLVEVKNVLNQQSIKDKAKIKNPYKVLAEAVINGAKTASVDLLFKILKDSLAVVCDDDLLNPNTTQNPFETHSPVEGFNGSTNNNKSVLDKNKGNVLDKIFKEEVKRGLDKTYTVSLLSELINDINCILTPLESVNLLRGEPTQLVETLIANIIKSKYSEPPNDLTFIIKDKSKMRAFFKELGLTIDQETIETIEKQISHDTIPSQVCSPEQLIARENIIKNKLPKNLGLEILDRQNRNRTKKARELLDTIKNGATQVNVSALCPEIENSELEAAKDYLFANYERYLSNLFKEVLNSFNSEADLLPDMFKESRHIFRKDVDSTIFDSIEYTTYFSDASKNINFSNTKNLDGDVTNPRFETARTVELVFNEEQGGYLLPSNPEFFYTQKYIIEKNQETNVAPEISTTQIGENITFICLPSSRQEISSDSFFYRFFTKQIPGTNVYFEAARFSEFFEESDMGDVYDDETGLDYQLRDLRFVFAVTINRGDYIKFSLWLNDKEKSEYKLKKEVYIRKDGYDPKNFNNKEYGELQDDFDNYIATNSRQRFLIDVPKKFYAGENLVTDDVKQVSMSGANNLATGVGLPDNLYYVFIIIKNEFENKFQPIIEPILNYDNLQKSLVNLNNGTLFKIKTDFNYQNGSLDKKASILALSGSSENSLQLVEVEYINVSLKNDIYKNSLLMDFFNANPQKDPAIPIEFRNSENYTQRRGETTGVEGYIGNNSYISLLIKHFYDWIRQKSTPFYFKEDFDPSDFIVSYIDTDGKAYVCDYNPVGDDNNFSFDIPKEIELDRSWKQVLEEREFKIEENNNKLYSAKDYVSRFKLFDYSKDQRFYNCRISPHYLNLDFFKKEALNDSRANLCDDNLTDALNKNTEEVLVNLTFRTFVTDLMIKCMPVWTLLTVEQINKILENNFLLNIVFDLLLKDLEEFSPQSNRKLYQKLLFEMTKRVYDNLEQNNKIKTEFKSQPKEEDLHKIEYFIKKEIRHFFKYCSSKSIFSFSKENLVDSFFSTSRENISADGKSILLTNIAVENIIELRNLKSSIEREGIPYPATENIKLFLEDELYSSIIYFVMANIVDGRKRSIFYSTKGILSKILLELAPKNSDEETIAIINDQPSQDDIFKFLSDLSYSSNPAVMVLLKPQYAKYIKDYLIGSLEFARSTILNVAIQTDSNIRITKLLNAALSTVGSVTWSLIDQNVRNNLILNSSAVETALTFSRLESGKSIFPDAVTSLGLVWPIFKIAPTKLGAGYLLIDTILETKWTLDTISKIKGQVPPNPCDDRTNSPDLTNSYSGVCTEETNKKLLESLNSLEEP